MLTAGTEELNILIPVTTSERQGRNMLTDEFFRDFRYRSFFIGNELICKALVFFFQTSLSGWVSLTIGEGTITLSLEDSEPLLLDLADIDDEFAYPVQAADELSRYVGQKIIDIYEYRIRGIEDGSVGVYFECEEGGFSILENEGCLCVSHGICRADEDVILTKLKV